LSKLYHDHAEKAIKSAKSSGNLTRLAVHPWILKFISGIELFLVVLLLMQKLQEQSIRCYTLDDKICTCGLYHPNYEIWANKGKYRLKTANISRFWLIFFDFENILRNNYAPFGCNYAPDWCIFLHLVIIKIGEINELEFKDRLQ
jgi:hypothetical protein